MHRFTRPRRSPRLPFRRPASAALVCLAFACRPSPDDPPTPIEDPDAELGAAKRKADADKKKKASKRREEAEARRSAGSKAPNDAPRTAALTPAAAQAAIGAPAPPFVLPQLDGARVQLAEHLGKTVGLEWFNPDCPFVKYAHEEGPLKDMAASFAERGVVWLSINSSAKDKQGFGAETNRAGVERYGMKNPVLLDAAGRVGRSYGAKSTPHMFVIDPAGKLAYAGALDNAPRGEADGDYVPYAAQAIDAVLEGKTPPRTETQPYGCSVKYAD